MTAINHLLFHLLRNYSFWRLLLQTSKLLGCLLPNIIILRMGVYISLTWMSHLHIVHLGVSLLLNYDLLLLALRHSHERLLVNACHLRLLLVMWLDKAANLLHSLLLVQHEQLLLDRATQMHLLFQSLLGLASRHAVEGAHLVVWFTFLRRCNYLSLFLVH